MKKVLMIMMCAVLMLTSACAGETKVKELNIQDLAEKLKVSGAFEENISNAMASIAADKAVNMYGADSADVKDAVYYTCVGATAAEILIFQGVDGAAAKRVYDLADAHLESLYKQYESYAPEEAKKVENAVTQQYGNYVIVVVSSNADIVKDVIGEATK